MESVNNLSTECVHANYSSVNMFKNRIDKLRQVTHSPAA